MNVLSVNRKVELDLPNYAKYFADLKGATGAETS